MPKEFLTFELSRNPGTPWGIRIGGGVDRGKVLVLEKVTFNTIAYEAGLRDRDFIVEINGKSVFDMNHDECTKLIKQAGDQLHIKVERGDHIVPSMDEAFPKKKKAEVPKAGPKPYWRQAMEEGKSMKKKTGFTTVGKPGMACKQYNSPLEMYSEEALEEIMRDGTLNGKPFDMGNMMNPTGKEFEHKNSAVLALILERSNHS